MFGFFEQFLSVYKTRKYFFWKMNLVEAIAQVYSYWLTALLLVTAPNLWREVHLKKSGEITGIHTYTRDGQLSKLMSMWPWIATLESDIGVSFKCVTVFIIILRRFTLGCFFIFCYFNSDIFWGEHQYTSHCKADRLSFCKNLSNTLSHTQLSGPIKNMH